MNSVCLIFVLTFTSFAYASDDQGSKAPEPPRPEGYVFCSGHENDGPVPAYLNLCQRIKTGALSCGQKVSVLKRHTDFLEIALPDGVSRFVSVSLI